MVPGVPPDMCYACTVIVLTVLYLGVLGCSDCGAFRGAVPEGWVRDQGGDRGVGRLWFVKVSEWSPQGVKSEI